MKKLNKTLLSIIILLSSLSCNKNSEKINDSKNYTYEEFDYAGVSHDNVMKLTYNTLLKKHRENSRVESINTLNYFQVRQLAYSYYDNVFIQTKDVEPIYYVNEIDYNTNIKNILDSTIKSICEDDTTVSYTKIDWAAFTNNQQTIAKEILAVTLNKNYSLTTILEKYNEIQNKIASLQNNEEKPFLYSTLSIARHSLTYWEENGEDWIISLGGTQADAAKVNWREVAETDVEAFCAGFGFGVRKGAIVGAIALGLETGGLAAIPGAVAGALIGGTATGLATAAAASTTKAIAQVIMSFWK